jgi:hypothetical protein
MSSKTKKPAAAAVTATTTNRQCGKTAAQWREVHDRSVIIPRKIRAGFKSLGAHWEYHNEFAELCGISSQELSGYIDHEEFPEHWLMTGGKNPKRCWCGTEELAFDLRGKRRASEEA